MDCMWCIPPLLVATVVLADYSIDNANTSVVYSQPTTGPAWQTFSVDTQREAFSITNSTGNYTFTVDPRFSYDQNYAYAECNTTDNCVVEVPFTGSGVTMYVLNAGSTGMGASITVDGGEAVSTTIKPPPPPYYQVSQVRFYQRQGLQTGNHTIKMTVIDRSGIATAMRFDFAQVNETFVASSTPSETVTTMTTTSTSSQPSSSTASANNSINYGNIIGATLGCAALLVSLVLIGFFCLRKRKAAAAWRRDVSPLDSNTHASPFTTEPNNPALSPQARQRSFSQRREEITPFTHPTIPLGPDHSSQSISSGKGLRSLQPLRRSTSQGEGNGIHAGVTTSHAVDTGPSFLNPQNALRLNLNAEQIEVINRLQRDSVPMDTIARIMGGFLSSNVDAGANDERLNRQENLLPTAPPPSIESVKKVFRHDQAGEGLYAFFELFSFPFSCPSFKFIVFLTPPLRLDSDSEADAFPPI